MDSVKLNKNGNNAKIKIHILDDESMRKLGFTSFNPDKWYICKGIKNEITFNIGINKNDENDWRIDILDEDFCQPYDYQYILERHPNSKFALEVKDKVEEYMEYFKNAGIISGHEFGEYI